MPVYVVQPTTRIVKAAYERSPVVALMTDAVSADAIPASVRTAADQVLTGNLSAVRTGKIPAGVDGVIIWFKGDRLVQGSSAGIRGDLFNPGRRCFVPVHLPCLPDIDLITLQPRWFAAGPKHDYWNFDFRIASAGKPSPEVVAAIKKNKTSWSRLSLALLAEQQQPGAGVEALQALSKNGNSPAILASLILRNLVVLLIRHDELDQADELLKLGMKAYPDYAELPYLTALLRIRQQQPSKAIPFLERAIKRTDKGFVGSGGEDSYRAQYLLGTFAASVGNQQMAFKHFIAGVLHRPAYAPSVEALLNQRFSFERVQSMQYDLTALVRREPQYLQPVFGYLLLHRAFAAARRLTKTLPLSDETRSALQEKLDAAAAPFRPACSPASSKPGVLLEGPLFVHSSLGRINREIGTAFLRATDLETVLAPCGYALVSPKQFPAAETLTLGLLRHPKRLSLTIRHQWPPNFRRPATGKLAHVVPWEYGAVPRKWVEDIQNTVDELWVPSNFVRDVFVQGGVDRKRVCVIPNGIDTSVFTPEGEAWRPTGARSFVFLFAGGPIRRKGVDLLLEAYDEAFRPGEDVTLIVADLSTHGFYQHNTLAEQVWQFARNRKTPHLQMLSKRLDDATLAALYRGCDVFVLPYRGEGFGMSLAEAMACGKPVVTTALGPAPEFCSSETGYLIPATVGLVSDDPPPLGELTGKFTWFEPDLRELTSTLRQVYEHRKEAARRGALAAERIKTTHAWPRIAELYLERIRHLTRG